MATQKQIEANRRNAQKSTGPRTEEGKAASRANAIVHGLAAHVIYKPIRHEDPADFHQMRAELFTSWSPEGSKEMQVVEMIAAAYKRIQRAEAFEAAYFDGAMETVQRRHRKPAAKTERDDLGCGIAFGDPRNELTWKNLDRYRRNAWSDYDRAVRRLQAMQKERMEAPIRAARAEAWQAKQEIWKAKQREKSIAEPVRIVYINKNKEQMGSFRHQNPRRASDDLVNPERNCPAHPDMDMSSDSNAGVVPTEPAR